MSQVLRRGIQPLSRTRVLPRLGFRAQARYAQIRAAPAEQPAQTDQLPVAGTPSSVESADARFDVVGAPYSLLSVSLSASQNLFTRRGTLVGLSGKADNVVSSLSVLEPFRRAAVGVPFLYQKVSSASPVTALVSVRSPNTSFAVVHLNGSVDWMVAQRRALLAWTGRSLAIRPTVNTGLSMAHWGSSEVTGRGLMALVGTGQLYSIELKKGEQYIAHPSNVVAYTMSSNPPRPYRFKSTTLNLQVPGLKSLPGFIQNAKFFQDVSGSQAWKTTMNVLHRLRTFTRKTIWGDRLFLQFDGPTNILIQTRGPRINDIMTSQEVNEIAETPRGVTRDPSKQESPKPKEEGGFLKGSEKAANADHAPTRSVDDIAKEVKGDGQHIANITKDGKVAFDKPKPITEDRQFVKDAEEATHNAPAPSRSVEDVTKEVKGDGQKIANITKDGKVVFDKPKAEDEQFLKDAEEATHNAPAPSRSVGDVAKEVKGDDQNIANITKDGKVVFDKPEGQKS